MLEALSGGYGSFIESLAGALVGKKLTGLRIERGESHMALLTPDGAVYLEAQGDCCSESWFADIVGISGALGSEITSVEYVDLPAPSDGRTRQEEDVAYGLKIATTGGTLDVIFRNSSNGYYGGWLETVNELPTDDWADITEDWQA